MSKFFLFLPLSLFAYYINFPFSLTLKKDEVAYFEVDRQYPLELRWTLFINNVLTVLYRYDNFPRQITLFKDELNSFKIVLNRVNGAYLYLVFKDFQKDKATFEIYLFKNALVDFKGTKWNISKY